MRSRASETTVRHAAAHFAALLALALHLAASAMICAGPAMPALPWSLGVICHAPGQAQAPPPSHHSGAPAPCPLCSSLAAASALAASGPPAPLPVIRHGAAPRAAWLPRPLPPLWLQAALPRGPPSLRRA